MGTYIEPFDFRHIIMDLFLGTEQLFMYAFIIIFSYISARYGFSNKIFLSLLAVGGIMFAFWLGSGLYFLIVVVVGLIVFRVLGRFISG